MKEIPWTERTGGAITFEECYREAKTAFETFFEIDIENNREIKELYLKHVGSLLYTNVALHYVADEKNAATSKESKDALEESDNALCGMISHFLSKAKKDSLLPDNSGLSSKLPYEAAMEFKDYLKKSIPEWVNGLSSSAEPNQR